MLEELQPIDARDAARDTRNTTELSTYCNRLVELFMDSSLEAIQVCESALWTVDELYKCLWYIGTKKQWRKVFDVHKRGERVVLIKKSRGE